MSGYNGWKNYQTWNVALWIDNDAFLRGVAQESRDYVEFRENLREGLIDSLPFAATKNFVCRELAFETPDKVSWNDSAINQDELAEFWNDNDFGKVR